MKKTYEQNTVRISEDPNYYGSECTEQDAKNIVKTLSQMIQSEFPGCNVEIFKDGQNSGKTTGPDAEEIDAWIAENWTKAL